MIKIIIKIQGGIGNEKIKLYRIRCPQKNIVMGESRKTGEAKITGEFTNTDNGIKKLLTKLNKLSEESELKICYEAGPCGYALKRIFDIKGYSCKIIAPSLIPVAKGNKIKTDKRDAVKLARLFRAGELTFIQVPDEDKESVRDLVRCRDDVMSDLKRAKQRLNHFLIRHGYHYPGTNWTQEYLKWISNLEFSDKNLQNVLLFYNNEQVDSSSK